MLSFSKLTFSCPLVPRQPPPPRRQFQGTYKSEWRLKMGNHKVPGTKSLEHTNEGTWYKDKLVYLLIN